MTSPSVVDASVDTPVDAPASAAAPSFRELGVSAAAASALEKRGYTHPLPVQAMVLPDILEGRDILAKSPTGSGKTLAFMVPLLDSLDANSNNRPQALILAPTRELASQIVEESREVAHALALRISAVYGGVGIQKQARDAARAHVIVATPGRLEDLLQRRAFNLSQVEILVLDEADRMLDMGFKPAIDRVVALCPNDRQTLFFSATLDGEAGKIAQQFTVDAVKHEHAPPTRPITEMDHRFVDTRGNDKVDILIEQLESEPRGLAIVFVRTKHGADRLARRLDDAGVNSGAMHGGKTQGQRERALRSFERGQINVLVATDVAARGIDIDDITHVINYDAPEDREAYVHRIGRTGRAGRTGIGITLVAPGQEGEVAAIARELKLEDRFAAGGFDPNTRFSGKKKKGGGGGGNRYGGGGGGGQRGGNSYGGGGGQRSDRGSYGGGGGSYGGSSEGGGSYGGGQGGRDGGRSHGGKVRGSTGRGPVGNRDGARSAGAQSRDAGGARPGQQRSGGTGGQSRPDGGRSHGAPRSHDGGSQRSSGGYRSR